MTEQITGSESLVKSLQNAGVEVVFGIPGGAILPAYDPLMDASGIRHILVGLCCSLLSPRLGPFP